MATTNRRKLVVVAVVGSMVVGLWFLAWYHWPRQLTWGAPARAVRHAVVVARDPAGGLALEHRGSIPLGSTYATRVVYMFSRNQLYAIKIWFPDELEAQRFLDESIPTSWGGTPSFEQVKVGSWLLRDTAVDTAYDAETHEPVITLFSRSLAMAP